MASNEIIEVIEETGGDLDNFYSTLFRAIKSCYQRQVFCDVKLFACQDGAFELRPIHCHALVLTSVAPAFKTMLLECEDDKEIFLPDLPYSLVKKFINDIYDGLCSNEFMLDISPDLAEAFGMFNEEQEGKMVQKVTKDRMVEIVVENSGSSATQEFELIVPESYEGSNFGTYLVDAAMASFLETDQEDEEHEHKHGVTPKRTYMRSGRKRAAAGEAWGPVAKIVPSKRACFGPSLFSTAIKASPVKSLEDLKSNLNSIEGVFAAYTNSYYTVSRVTNEKGLVLTSGDGGPERQFRMKLPDKSVVAFVAVGCRDGRNLACTLATTDASSWSSKSTFLNLIEATKRIGGLSFGDILKHPRCSDSELAKEKLSKSRANAVKLHFKELSETERANQLLKTVAELKPYDDKSEQMTFHHLPGKKTLLEFYLTQDLQPDEILDYCIVHGNSPEELTIQSFFNFAVQKFTKLRLITTMCDTLACFLGLNNDNALSEYLHVVEAYDKYAQKTVETIALQDLLSAEGRNKCKDLIEITDANYVPLEETITDVIVVDGKIVVKPVSKTIHIPPAHVPSTDANNGPLAAAPKRGTKRKAAKEIPCPIAECKKVFSKEVLLQGHIERMHSCNSGKVEKACTVCGKKLKGSQSLRDHIYYYHSPKSCEVCDEQFPGAYLYYYHKNKFHTVSVFCDVCGTEFKSKEKLRVHKINKHLKDEQKPYVCSLCGKGYAHKTKLESHQMNVHIRSRPYKCRLESCDADFNELANRNAHERNVHQFDFKKILSEAEIEVPM